MSTKIEGTSGVEFPDASVQSSAAFTKAESDARDPVVGSLAAQTVDPGIAIPPSTPTKIAAISVIKNDGGGWNPTTAEFTAPVSGYYSVTAAAVFHIAFVAINKALAIAGDFAGEIAFLRDDAGEGLMFGATVIYLSAGQKIWFTLFQSSGATLFQGWQFNRSRVGIALIKKG